MKIAVVTLGTENIESYTKYTFDLNKRYCMRHGYDFIRYLGAIDQSRPVPWSKLLALKKHLNNYDWLFWIDADAIFHNPLIRIEERIDDRYNFICGKAFGESWTSYSKNPEIVNVNSGVFLLKGKSSWSTRFINNLYRRTERINHMWWENQALIDLILENNLYFTGRISIVDQYLLNGFLQSLYGYSDYDENQYILHLAGMSSYERDAIFKEQSERILSKYYNE